MFCRTDRSGESNRICPGDFSTISSNPYPPLLVTPLNNAIAPISTGGTFDWDFTSPVIGDAQTAYNFRRQVSGGAYQWWDGAAWQSTSQTVTTASTLITFPTSQWTAAATYTWWVQSVGAAPNNNLSGYSSGFTVTVANPAPATPTLTATYDATLNRTALTLHSGDATGPTGSIEFSDDAGLTWNFVRFCTALTIYPGTTTAYDYEAPGGATRQYRGQSWTGAPQSFSAYATANATPTISQFWLRDVTGSVGNVNLNVLPGSLATHFPEANTQHQGLGNKAATVIADVIGLEDGAVTVWTMSTSDETGLLALLLAQQTLLLQAPDGRAWYIRIVDNRPTDVPYLYRAGTYRTHALVWRGQPRP